MGVLPLLTLIVACIKLALAISEFLRAHPDMIDDLTTLRVALAHAQGEAEAAHTLHTPPEAP